MIAMNTMAHSLQNLMEMALERSKATYTMKLQEQVKDLERETLELQQKCEFLETQCQEKEDEWAEAKEKLESQVAEEAKKREAAEEDLDSLWKSVNAAVLDSIKKELTVRPEEGMWLDKTKTQFFLQNAKEMVSQHAQKILTLSEDQEEEEPEEPDEDEENEEGSEKEDKNDEDDDETSTGHPNPPDDQNDKDEMRDKGDQQHSESENATEAQRYERKEAGRRGKQKSHGLVNEALDSTHNYDERETQPSKAEPETQILEEPFCSDMEF